ncbi:DUF6483 family protein [Tissierella creatinophila]|uniref:Uncharacterized protein n=1 Tax=Tissierella creatinophila DSM 6911 TaxID=1123403 RepID=A0A1U7M750_TISCR|nr:DUF6483 family protein [Tissierella creatinophila]OLS03080.1 hypothetical protein TICRE_07760 [Tissierella creatinophila DSM 6911]
MYKEDWLIRQIKNTIRIIMWILFKRKSVEYEIVDEYNYKKTDLLHKEILKLLSELKINKAENLLFETIDSGDLNFLRLSLDFYNRLNGLSDEELKKGNFAREEIEMGLNDILEIYGVKDLNI